MCIAIKANCLIEFCTKSHLLADQTKQPQLIRLQHLNHYHYFEVLHNIVHKSLSYFYLLIIWYNASLSRNAAYLADYPQSQLAQLFQSGAKLDESVISATGHFSNPHKHQYVLVYGERRDMNQIYRKIRCHYRTLYSAV